MDARLLRHYERELAHIREMGGEFAESFPKIASRLGLDATEVVDPYVERLIEGVAFLNARIQLELELQYPAFTSHLLEIVYPHYLGPTPSMMIAELLPDRGSAALDAGYVLPRHTPLRSWVAEGTQTSCIFRTAQRTVLWPVEVAEAEYLPARGDLVAAKVAGAGDARAGLRLRLRRIGDQPIGKLELDRLTFFLSGQGSLGYRLHELLCSRSTALVARSTDRRMDWTVVLDGKVMPRGFEPDEALLPSPRPSFDGYRLLQEFFAMPERFRFVEIGGLDRALARCEGREFDLYILLRDGDPAIAAGVAPEAFRLNCVPAVNLFEKRCDRVHVTVADVEQHVVPDRTAPLDYEIHSVEEVVGISGTGEDDVAFLPFYSADEFTTAAGRAPAYYAQRRRMRQRSERERLKGSRSATYLGSEVYLSLVDRSHAPYPGGLRQLAVKAMVTNRDLPLLLSTGASDVFHLPDGGPVSAVRTPVPPTRPRPSLAQGENAWRLISHLSLNYLSISEGSEGGAKALRELVGLYSPPGDRAVEKQLEGILRVSSRPIVRRIVDEVLSTAVRGIEITVHCDEDLFDGSSAYLLVSVLERFFRAYVSINAFTETVLVTQQRGEVARWLPQKGLTRII